MHISKSWLEAFDSFLSIKSNNQINSSLSCFWTQVCKCSSHLYVKIKSRISNY